MKIETKESGACVVALTVTADADEVQVPYKKVLNGFLREAVVPGFRRGKVPQNIILQKFAAEISDESKRACIQEFYPKAVRESELKVVSFQGVQQEIAFSPTTGITFTAVVEVMPQFKLPKYKNLAIKVGNTAVTDEQVADRMESFRKAFAKYEDAPEGASVAEGDFVQFDYAGALDVKAKTPLSEVVPDQKAICSGTGFWTQLEEGRFVPEILEALKGMKVGETKDDVKVKFPKDNAPEPIQGKKCVYTVTVKAFRVRTLPDDAAFVEAAKAESLEALRKQIREQMEKDAAVAELEARKNQAIELLLAKADFDVPPSLVQRQMQGHLEELAQRAQYAGLPADYIEKNRDKILQEAETGATRQVRLSYILLGIAKEENIEATDADVNAGLEKMADGKTTAAELLKRLQENDQVDLYKEQLRAEKALDLVLAAAK